MAHLLRSNLVAFVLICTSVAASAQIKIAIVSTVPDPVGERLVYANKEGIRRSSGMQVVDRVQDGLIRVNIVTLDPDKSDSSGNRTIYSVVWTAQTFHEIPVTMYLTNSVGICGSSRVSQCADGLIANTDEQATNVRGWIQGTLEKGKK